MTLDSLVSSLVSTILRGDPTFCYAEHSVGSVQEVRYLIVENKLRFPFILSWDSGAAVGGQRFVSNEETLEKIFDGCIAESSTERLTARTFIASNLW